MFDVAGAQDLEIRAKSSGFEARSSDFGLEMLQKVSDNGRKRPTCNSLCLLGRTAAEGRQNLFARTLTHRLEPKPRKVLEGLRAQNAGGRKAVRQRSTLNFPCPLPLQDGPSPSLRCHAAAASCPSPGERTSVCLETCGWGGCRLL